MEKFSQIDGLAAPLMRANIDTDSYLGQLSRGRAALDSLLS